MLKKLVFFLYFGSLVALYCNLILVNKSVTADVMVLMPGATEKVIVQPEQQTGMPKLLLGSHHGPNITTHS